MGCIFAFKRGDVIFRGACVLFFMMSSSLFSSDLTPNLQDGLAGAQFTSHQYAGRKLSLEAAGMPPSSNFSWQITSQSRILVSGRAKSGPDGRLRLEFETPPLRAGVVMKAVLSVLDERGVQSGRADMTFHSGNVLGEGAFLQSCASAGIWSPSAKKAEQLSAILSAQGMKPESADSVSSFKGGLLIVSGLNFEEYPEMFDTMLAAARKGTAVIVFNPPGGTISLKTEKFDSILLDKGIPEIAFSDRSLGRDLRLFANNHSSHGFQLGSSQYPLELKIKRREKPQDEFNFCRLTAGPGAIFLIAVDLGEVVNESPVPLVILRKILTKIEDNNRGKEKGNEKKSDDRNHGS